MKKSLFEIIKMDCPSEEQLIRLALGKYKSAHLQFDLPVRRLTVIHDERTEDIAKDLEKLNLGSRFLEEAETSAVASSIQTSDESRILWILLAINFAMFILEIGVGFYAQSTGLIADSLDMLADAAVYSMSLYAVGRSHLIQHRAARLSGWFQLLLAFGAFSEVARRFIFGSEPNSIFMMGMSFVALCANVTCLLLLMKHRQGAVHMRASWIFSTNDVLANIGVLLAGALVYFFKSSWPDLVIGLLIAAIVTRGALSIMKLSSVQEAIDEA
ncbi:MAG: cation transporter [Nitrosomonas ureae]